MRLCAFSLIGAVAQSAQDGSLGYGDPSAYDLAFFKTRETELWIRAGSESLDPIRIGAILTLSYSHATSDASGKAVVAYENFVEYVNVRLGGLPVGNTRRPIELLVLDDQGDSQRAKDAAVHLAQSGVELFLGPLGDDGNMAMAAGLGENTSVMITAGTAHEGTFIANPHVFGVLPPMFFNATIGLLVSQQPRAQTMVVLRDASGTACDDIEDIASVHGLSLLSVIALPQPWGGTAGRAAITSSLQHIGSAPDIVVACTASSCADLFYALEDLQMTPLAVALAGCVNSTGYMTDLPPQPSAARKAYYHFAVSDWSALFSQAQDSSGMTSEDFLSFFEDRYGILADRNLANSWLALNCLTEAIHAANSTQPKRVQAALRNLSFRTIAGPVSFDVNGQAVRPVFTSQLAGDGKARLLLPPPSLEPVVHPFPPWSTRDCLGPRAEPVANDSSAMGFVLSASGGQPDCVLCNTTLWAGGVWSGEPGWLCVDRLCDPGQKQVGSGACEDCSAGWYSNSRTSVECTLCPPGTISDPGQTSCEPCPLGTTSLAWGSSICETCAPGKYTPIKGSSTCFSCPAGFHAPEPGSHHCTFCHGGRVASTRGMSQCEECPAGMYGARGSSECTACEAGRYQRSPASAGCLECPDGSFCEEPGLAYPLNMDAWWIWNSSSGDLSLHKCLQRGACLEDARCREGHTGYLCQVCVARHTMGGDGCEPCDMTAANVRDGFATAGVLVFLCVACVLVTRLAIATAGNRDFTSGLMKQFFNHWATMAVMGDVQAYMFHMLSRDNPSWAQGDWRVRLITFQLWFMSSRPNVFFANGVRCLVQPSVPDDLSSQIEAMSRLQHHEQFGEDFDDLRAELEHVHYVEALRQTLVWGMVAAPAVGTICLFALWRYSRRIRWHYFEYRQSADFFMVVESRGWSEAIAETRWRHLSVKTVMGICNHRVFGIWPSLKLFNRRAKGRLSFMARFVRDAEPLAVVVAFCIYPYVLQGVMLPLKCRQPFHDEDVGLRMVDFPDVDCCAWGSLQVTSVALIALTGLGLPMLFLVNLRRSTLQSREGARFACSWGFLTVGYKAYYRWWEIVIFLRKAITVVVGSMRMPMGVRVLSFFSCSTFFLGLHLLHKPMPIDIGCNHALDRMEQRHLQSWVLYSGVLLFEHSVGSGGVSLNMLFGMSTLLCVVHFWLCFDIVRLFLMHLLKQVGETSLRLCYRAQYIEYVERLRKHAEKHRRQRLRDSEKFIPVPPPVKMLMREAIAKESTYAGFGLMWLYRRHLQATPYVSVDADRMWITLVGDQGDSCDKVRKASGSGGQPRLSDRTEAKHTPPCKQACRELVASLEEGVAAIVFQLEYPVMTMNLLDFIVRCGFCFDGDGRRASFLVEVGKTSETTTDGGVSPISLDDGSVTSMARQQSKLFSSMFSALFSQRAESTTVSAKVLAASPGIAKDVSHMHDHDCFLRGYTIEAFELSLGSKLLPVQKHLLAERLDQYEERATRHILGPTRPDAEGFKPALLLDSPPPPSPAPSDLEEWAPLPHRAERRRRELQEDVRIFQAPQDDTEDVQAPVQPGRAPMVDGENKNDFEAAALRWMAIVMRRLQWHQAVHELEFRRRALCRLREQVVDEAQAESACEKFLPLRGAAVAGAQELIMIWIDDDEELPSSSNSVPSPESGDEHDYAEPLQSAAVTGAQERIIISIDDDEEPPSSSNGVPSPEPGDEHDFAETLQSAAVTGAQERIMISIDDDEEPPSSSSGVPSPEPGDEHDFAEPLQSAAVTEGERLVISLYGGEDSHHVPPRSSSGMLGPGFGNNTSRVLGFSPRPYTIPRLPLSPATEDSARVPGT